MYDERARPPLLAGNRFLVLVASMVLELCGGSIYVTSLYKIEMRDRWGVSASDMDQLIFACNLGNWIPLAGFFYDWRHGGPQRTVLAGAVLTLIGYAGLWLMSVVSSSPPVWLLWVFWFLWGHGSGYFDCAAVTTNGRNFDKHRGSAIGIIKAFYGLSGSVITQYYKAFFSAIAGSGPSFLLSLGIALSAMGAAVTPLVRRAPTPDASPDFDAPRRRFGLATLNILGLALFMAAVGLCRSFIPAVGSGDGAATFSYAAFAFTIVGVAPLPLLAWGASPLPHSMALLPKDAPPSACSTSDEGTRAPPNHDDGAIINVAPALAAAASAPLMPDHGGGGGGSSGGGGEDSAAAAGSSASEGGSLTNAPIGQTARSLNFWLLFVAFFAGTGGGLVVCNNLQELVDAQLATPGGGLESAKRASDTLTNLFSVMNCLGRLGAGLGADALRGRVARPALFCVATLAMGLAHIVLLGASQMPLLYGGVLLSGLSYGAFWSLLPTLVAELFGVDSFASTYNTFSLAVSLASFVLATHLVAVIYDANTLDEALPPMPPGASAPSPPPCPPGASPSPPSQPLCYGDGCFRVTHLVTPALCACGVATTALLWMRTRRFYQR